MIDYPHIPEEETEVLSDKVTHYLSEMKYEGRTNGKIHVPVLVFSVLPLYSLVSLVSLLAHFPVLGVIMRATMI
jgi:hypothetical protein